MTSLPLRSNPLPGLSELFRLRAGKPAVPVTEAVLWLRERITAGEGAGLPCCRVLVGATDGYTAPHGAALAIARALAEDGRRTLLVDTSQGAASLSAPLEMPRSPGLAELCQQRAGFEMVIRRDPGSNVHFLASGRPRSIAGDWGPPGRLDRICRAIDAVYGVAMFCADYEEAVALTEGLKRPFDAAVLLKGRSRRGLSPDSAEGAQLDSLGFPVFWLEQRG